jgi:2-keto-3-deoxy-L-rhamnonate aldolase RhmA
MRLNRLRDLTCDGRIAVEALQNLEAIAAVDGIDAAFVGPQDLSLSMHKPGRRLTTLGGQLIVSSAAGFMAAAAGAYLHEVPRER